MDVIYRNPKIYLISGKARSGKTNAGEMIKETYESNGKKAVVLLYASYLKNYAKLYFGWDGREETKPRELLQQLGTDIIREKLDMPLFLVNRMTEDVKILSYFFDVIIINDVRFKIEIDTAKKLFNNLVTIRINRNNFDNGLTEEQKKHQSEVDLDDYSDFDYYVENDGTLDDLKQRIEDIINKEEAV